MSVDGTIAMEQPGDHFTLDYWSGAKDIDWQKYDDLRPPYPDRLLKEIVDYHKGNNGGKDKVLDVGTGPGTLVPFLLSHFQSMIASDLIEIQLEVAEKRFSAGYGHRISYVQSRGEDLSWLPDSSVDMVTCAETIHWLPPAFVTEAARVLRPRGTIAVIMYPPYFDITDNKEADILLGRLQDALLEPIMESDDPGMINGRKVAGSNLDNIRFPKEKFEKEMRLKWNPNKEKSATWVEGLVVPDNRQGEEKIFQDKSFFSGRFTSTKIRLHLLSMGHVPTFLREHQKIHELFEETFKQLDNLLGENTVTASWPITLALACKR